MPFVPNTPEASLGRSDSLNPEATCRGITSNGRPCRRPVAASDTLQPNSRIRTSDPRDDNLYCWQHKEQAAASAHSSPGPRYSATPILEERSSLDTLADRLGLVDLQDKPPRKYGRPQTAQSNGGYRPPSAQSNGGYPPRPQSTRKSLTCCFCFSLPLGDLDEKDPSPRPQPRPVQPTGRPTSASTPRPTSASRPNSRLSPSAAGGKGRKSTSSTGQIKDLIPDSLDAATASALMKELSRPWVDSEEPGFIYMFWLTPLSDSKPPADEARSMLAPPTGTRSRRPSDVVSKFADKRDDTSKTMMLKIGRAANVQRRINQWQRQCGKDITLLRYYPYIPGAVESSGVVPHMTPHVHRVERLIHIELQGMGMRANQDTCEACGTNHREWFEVDASRDGIRQVDGLIRKWIEWDETA